MKKKKKIRRDEHSEVKRSERYYADLSKPMLFAFTEAFFLLAICAVLNVFFKTEENDKIISAVCSLALPIYILSAGVVCLIYVIRNSRTKKARLEARML